MSIKVEIKGLEELKSSFKKSPELVKKYIGEAINKSIQTIQAKAVPFTPKDTGFLKGSFSASFGTLRGSLENTAPYAGYVHDGTKFMKGRPYLEQGTRAAESAIQSFFDSAMDKIAKEL